MDILVLLIVSSGAGASWQPMQKLAEYEIIWLRREEYKGDWHVAPVHHSVTIGDISFDMPSTSTNSCATPTSSLGFDHSVVRLIILQLRGFHDHDINREQFVHFIVAP